MENQHKFSNENIVKAIRSNTIETELYLNNLVESGLSMELAKKKETIIKMMIAHNIIPRKTWEHAIKSKSKKLTPLNSERLLRTMKIVELAKQAFGDELGEEWIERPTKIFNGKAPIEMLTNESGSRAIELFLNRVMHGFNA